MECTRCGLCLESCPTYTLLGAEPDSPRGRIAIIEQILADDANVTADAALRIDRCLGCMACMTVCPEEVPYGDLLAAAHATIERNAARPAGHVALRAEVIRLVEASGVRTRSRVPHHTAAERPSRGRVGLLADCGDRGQDADLHAAALAVLSAEGFEVIAPRLPSCCGALELHSGDRRRAVRQAQATIAAFAAVGGVDHVVTTSGSCGAALKAYGRLLGTPEALAFSALTLDIHELLARAPLRSRLGALAIRAAYHDSCQLRHAQGVTDPPRDLLLRIPGIELVELDADAGACCGAPGRYPSRQPQIAAALGHRQARALADSGAELVVTTDRACRSQLEHHLRELGGRMSVRRPIELLARSIDAGRAAPH